MASVPRSEGNAAIPALTAERPVIWPQRVRTTLSNGLEVVLVESHTIPKFTGQLFFRSGNAVTAAYAPGLADMTATVARTGTTARSSRQIEEDLRRMGADLSTGAGADTSAVSFAGLSDFSNDLLRLVAELTQNACFPREEFERERRQLVEGLKIERTTPGFLASERLRRVLFGTHPYGTISPTEPQAEAYRLEQLKDFYKQYYRPGNALLVLVGDFCAEGDARANRGNFRFLARREGGRCSESRLAGTRRPESVSGASAGIGADAGAGRQPGHHAPEPGLAALWFSRIRFTAGRLIRGW